jgi:Family of unknown function (DUF6492)
MITRIFLIGPGRINEAAVTLNFDHNLNPKPDKTYIISPYVEKPEIIHNTFLKFGLDAFNYELLDDIYFEKYYDLSRWKNDHWYLQQAIKLCALDHFDSDYFLIQDCDQVPLKQFDFFVDGKLNFKAENLWNSYQELYADMVTRLTGITRTINYSLVNELMPYSKQDWQDLKSLIETRSGKNWLDAIPDSRPFEECKWFSEFELLGMYKTSQSTGWTHYRAVPQPPINTWEDFFKHDWSQQDTIKFLTQPMKYMNQQDALVVLDHLKQLTDDTV